MDGCGWMWMDVYGGSLDGRWMVVGWSWGGWSIHIHPHPSTSIHIHIHPSSKYRPNLENRKSQVHPPGVKSHALNSCLVVPMSNSSQNSSTPEFSWEPAYIHFYPPWEMQDQFSLSLGIAAGTGHTHFVGNSGMSNSRIPAHISLAKLEPKLEPKLL